MAALLAGRRVESPEMIFGGSGFRATYPGATADHVAITTITVIFAPLPAYFQRLLQANALTPNQPSLDPWVTPSFPLGHAEISTA